MSSDPSAERGPANSGASIYWLVAVVAVMCLGCPAYVWWATVSDRRDKPRMTAAATSYLDAWRDQQPGRAEDWVCGRERARRPEYRQLPYPGDQVLVSYRITEAKVHRSSDSPTVYSVDAQLVYAEGPSRLARYWMSDERAGWRVCTEVILG